MSARIAAQWASYREQVMPRDAGPVQVEETRLVFYAGATALFGLILHQLNPVADATDADLRMMDELNAELVAHVKDMRARARTK